MKFKFVMLRSQETFQSNPFSPPYVIPFTDPVILLHILGHKMHVTNVKPQWVTHTGKPLYTYTLYHQQQSFERRQSLHLVKHTHTLSKLQHGVTYRSLTQPCF